MSVQIQEKSIQLALVKAAAKLEVTQQDVEYKVLEEQKGFLGFFGRKILIEAWVRKKGRKRAGARREHTNKGSDNLNPLSSAEVDSLIQEITEFTRGICREVVGKNLKVESKHEAGKLIVNILSDEIAALFSKNTKLPEAFEHLLRKKPRQLMRELPFRIFVDAQGVRQKRENKLINMAKDLSNKVSESSKPIVLNYSNPYDRKVIHMALDQDTRVHTKSIGSGPSRRLMILPNRAPSV